MNDYSAEMKLIYDATSDPALIKTRIGLANFSAEIFAQAGKELSLIGQFLGPDRSTGISPFGNGSDESVALSTLLRISSQLISGAAVLFEKGNPYAAAALVRQLVEVEYLAWAIETKDGDGAKWLGSVVTRFD